jgi:hypothetical protein
MLASWELWRERNRHIFEKNVLSIGALVIRIRGEVTLWNLDVASFPFDPG